MTNGESPLKATSIIATECSLITSVWMAWLDPGQQGTQWSSNLRASALAWISTEAGDCPEPQADLPNWTEIKEINLSYTLKVSPDLGFTSIPSMADKPKTLYMLHTHTCVCVFI